MKRAAKKPNTTLRIFLRYAENIVKSMGGAIVSTDKWGTKKLAYPIAYKNEAYYVLMTFEAGAEVVNELDRVAGISANVMRRIITKL